MLQSSLRVTTSEPVSPGFAEVFEIDPRHVPRWQRHSYSVARRMLQSSLGQDVASHGLRRGISPLSIPRFDAKVLRRVPNPIKSIPRVLDIAATSVSTPPPPNPDVFLRLRRLACPPVPVWWLSQISLSLRDSWLLCPGTIEVEFCSAAPASLQRFARVQTTVGRSPRGFRMPSAAGWCEATGAGHSPLFHPCGLLVTGEALHAQTLVRCTVAGMEEPCHVPGLRLLSFLQPPPSFFFFSHTQPLPRPVVISRALARLRLVLPRVNPAVPSVHPRRCLGVSPALVPTPSRPRPHHPSWRCLAHAPSPPSLCESRSQLLRTLLRRTTSHNPRNTARAEISRVNVANHSKRGNTYCECERCKEHLGGLREFSDRLSLLDILGTDKGPQAPATFLQKSGAFIKTGSHDRNQSLPPEPKGGEEEDGSGSEGEYGGDGEFDSEHSGDD
ncbi:hypothetical protein C8R43DRAFT_955390 [Mycena crocata]|nr:hypothetical protein C8R43DRAFT_955390 [Mycena crocata]